MKPLYIFRHLEHEGPGYLTEVLDKYTIPYQLIRIDQGDAVPDNLDGTSGLVFMGGNMSVNDPLRWIDEELGLIRRAAEIDMPVLGHCLGGQLICKALGGEVTANPVKEIGWHAAQRVDNTVAHDWLGDLPQEMEMFHWHGETFTIPDGATRILQSRFCTNQAFVVGNILGLQCHVEMTPEMVREWARCSPDELAAPSESVQSAAQMTKNLEARASDLNEVADTLYDQWLQPFLQSGV
ncbi:MAG: type 1 glutamine amidotransferase [Gammaproteobacteria bacterium]|nr:type 1 glutamine amidotransferase [Gammaproteobacteria bacterium]